MNYTKIGQRIRLIRENELKISREVFAEKIDTSVHTITRIENATRKVTNIETYIKISNITGYSLDDLLNENLSMDRDRRRIDFLLNTLSINELKYIYNFINEFVLFISKIKEK